MTDVFEVVDKTGRHIQQEHGDVRAEDVELALTAPTKVVGSDRDSSVAWFFRYNRSKMVSVKYINGGGYVITAYHVTRIP